MPSHRIRRRGALWAALLLAAAILPGGNPAAARPPAQTGFPQQAGFPRTEPVGSMGLSSPAVADLDGDGALDVLAADSAGCVWAWTAPGVLRPGFPLMTSGSCAQATRINAPLAVGELDGDPQLEIVAGNRGPGTAPNQRGQVFAWNHDGSLLAGWPREMGWNAAFATGPAEITSVALADLTGDGRLEVLAGTSNNANLGRVGYDTAPNLYAWQADGRLVAGYPTWAGTAGIYGALGAADLQCDGSADVIVGRDHAYLHAYDSGADQFAAWPARTYLDPSRDTPGRDPALVFPIGAPALGDLDGRGGIEVVA
ncbi:MAG TPA: VCBS repeat-containing protein, partial [Herpetosiphonaceae bacterium]